MDAALNSWYRSLLSTSCPSFLMFFFFLSPVSLRIFSLYGSCSVLCGWLTEKNKKAKCWIFSPMHEPSQWCWIPPSQTKADRSILLWLWPQNWYLERSFSGKVNLRPLMVLGKINSVHTLEDNIKLCRIIWPWVPVDFFK